MRKENVNSWQELMQWFAGNNILVTPPDGIITEALLNNWVKSVYQTKKGEAMIEAKEKAIYVATDIIGKNFDIKTIEDLERVFTPIVDLIYKKLTETDS